MDFTFESTDIYILTERCLWNNYYFSIQPQIQKCKYASDTAGLNVYDKLDL